LVIVVLQGQWLLVAVCQLQERQLGLLRAGARITQQEVAGLNKRALELGATGAMPPIIASI
jgi:hypothetical protein